MKRLIESLRERKTPEQIVNLILDSDLSLSKSERRQLGQIVSERPYSYMSSSFRESEAKERQLKVAQDLFPDVPAPEVFTPETARDYLDQLKASLEVSGTDFASNRLDREQREKRGLPRSHRAYNKRFRFLARMEEHLGAWTSSAQMRELAQVAKSRLAFKVNPETITDLASACFLAYIVATMNRRSIFTFGKQERAFDEIANMLLKKLDKKSADWLAVAYVHPSPEVLANLSQEELGILLGEWYDVMLSSSRILQGLAGTIDIKSMIVKRGNDSSTWNEAAGAYNKARDGWINTLHALGADSLLDSIAPPKALRLMAADVAWGHRHFGSGEDPDTSVWNALPKPWEVLWGQVSCNRALIEKACGKSKVQGRGWIAPREKTVARFSPTPELVHGVIVSCPELAVELRKAGYFGGKSKKAPKEYIAFEKSFDGTTVSVRAIGQERMWEEVEELLSQYVPAN